MVGGAAGAGLWTNPAATIAIAGKGAVAAAPIIAAYSRVGSQFLTQGLAPASRERLVRYPEQEGLPREVIPTIVQRSMELAGRTVARPQGN